MIVNGAVSPYSNGTGTGTNLLDLSKTSHNATTQSPPLLAESTDRYALFSHQVGSTPAVDAILAMQSQQPSAFAAA